MPDEERPLRVRRTVREDSRSPREERPLRATRINAERVGSRPSERLSRDRQPRDQQPRDRQLRDRPLRRKSSTGDDVDGTLPVRRTRPAEALGRNDRLSEGSRYLLDALHSRKGVRRAIGGLALVLAVVGVGMLAYPFATNLYTRRVQDRLESELFTPELRAKYETGTLAVGDSLTRLSIPDIKVSIVVVEGVSANALRAGAGHYPNTPLPGEESNVAIAGHRSTYGKPFANLDQLESGDEIILETPLGKNYYRVSKAPYVVASDDWAPIAATPGRKTLTLTTCHPKGSAKQRLIVKADFVKVELSKAAEAKEAKGVQKNANS